MKRNKLFRLSVGVCLVLVLVVLAFTSACAPQQPAGPIVLKAVTSLPTTSFSNEPFWWVNEQINQRSNGELRIEFLGGPEAIPGPDQAVALKQGVVDYAFNFAGVYAGIVPGIEILSVSRITPAQERAGGFFDFMAELHKDAGLVYLGRGGSVDGANSRYFYIWTKERVERPTDLAGMKITCFSTQSNAFLEALGAIPVILPAGELFTAVDTGVVDGFWLPIPTAVPMGMYETVPYLIDHSYFHTNSTFLINPDVWDGLPNHLQDLMTEIIIESEQAMPAVTAAKEQEMRQILLAAGIEFIKFSPDDAKWFVDIAYDAEWAKQYEKYPDLAPQFRALLT